MFGFWFRGRACGAHLAVFQLQLTGMGGAEACLDAGDERLVVASWVVGGIAGGCCSRQITTDSVSTALCLLCWQLFACLHTCYSMHRVVSAQSWRCCKKDVCSGCRPLTGVLDRETGHLEGR